MGTIEPFEENESWEKKVKSLPDEELLEIWAESQELQNILDHHAPGHGFLAASFEQAIIHELALRTTQRLSGQCP